MAPLTSLFLLSGILCGLFIGRIEAAPAIYDQQQTGELNVDAKLDNFLIVVANTFNEGLLEKLASQAAIQLGMLAARRNAAKQRPEKPLEPTIYETEGKEEGREPYHVEIVRIEKDGDDIARRKYPPRVLEVDYIEEAQDKVTGKAGQAAPTTSDNGPDPQVSINNKNVEKRSRSVWGNQKNRRLIGERSKEVLHVDSSEENLAQADDLVAREVLSKAARPGISLKKQLSKKEEEMSLVSEDRNELSNKSDELVLLGGGVENCGPGRYRDKSGICQEDKDFYKDLY